MNRPSFEVADIVRAAGQRFIDKNGSWLTGLHRKVLAGGERLRHRLGHLNLAGPLRTAQRRHRALQQFGDRG